jgi:hypothetical protein
MAKYYKIMPFNTTKLSGKRLMKHKNKLRNMA